MSEDDELDLLSETFDGVANDLERALAAHKQQIILVSNATGFDEVWANNFLMLMYAQGLVFMNEAEVRLVERQAIMRYKLGLGESHDEETET